VKIIMRNAVHFSLEGEEETYYGDCDTGRRAPESYSTNDSSSTMEKEESSLGDMTEDTATTGVGPTEESLSYL
jgi:hypothetical protein